MKRRNPGTQTAARTAYEVVPVRGGLRLQQHDTVLSEVRLRPGPTHSVADVMAAAAHLLQPGGRVAMLGFAGGGLLAPLRAMGGRQAVAAVDLDDSGWQLFCRHCSEWAGRVRFTRGDACRWLRGLEGRFDFVLEDLSISIDSKVVKPEATWSRLPALIHRCVTRNGTALFNLLRPTHGSWSNGVQRILKSGFESRLVLFEDYENRLVLVSRQLPSAHRLSRGLRERLRFIGSRLASRISVHTRTF
jgi:hypothetical protein